MGPRDLYFQAFSAAFVPDGEPKRITCDNTILEETAWTSKGRDIVFSSARSGGRLWKIALPRLGGSPGRPQRLGRIRGSSPTISRQGPRLAYAAGSWGDLDIWRVQIPDWRKSGSASAPTKFISSTHDEFAQYSPDGLKFAFESVRSGRLEIWACASDGSNCGQLPSFGGPLTCLPQWSPDSQRIAFYSRVEDKARIHIINAEGGVPQRLTNDDDNMLSNCSRDGRRIYFSSNRSGKDQIWKMPSSGGAAAQVTGNGGFAVTESPDGKYLYYIRSKDRNTVLCRMPAEGGPEALVLESVVLFNYAVTGHGIYFMTQPDSRASKKLIQFLSCGDQTTKIIASTDLDVYCWPRRLAG
ncbi:MAG: hypothetical protein DMG57_15895 [Acidobacteria bacterium]|nr:MAG: hypothetical protein DMG57_15895 [Acidobacteriota bacterium]